MTDPAEPTGAEIFVYVAGPYTKPDPAVNVKRALDAGAELSSRGYVPYIPHLTHFRHMHSPADYEQWMREDFAWLKQCHVMLRLGGESSGADREHAYANRIKIPVVHSIDELDRLNKLAMVKGMFDK